jgi:kynurenine formamidase
LHGHFHGGHEIRQSSAGGVEAHAIDTVGPIVRRGVLLDIAGLVTDGAPLAKDFLVAPAHLDAAVERQGVTIEPGDVVLLRTGWAQYWSDARRFLAEVHGPGPGRAGAEWLSSRGIFAAGSDTIAFEFLPDPSMPAHLHLLVESGIHIIECLNLEQLARDRVWSFTFVASPMKLSGATGAPLSPLAFSE